MKEQCRIGKCDNILIKKINKYFWFRYCRLFNCKPNASLYIRYVLRINKIVGPLR